MTTSKIQTGDAVKVIAGKYKGTTGTVTGTYSKTRKNGVVIKRVTISGLEMQVAYQRGFKAAGMAGQLLSKERSVDVSNVALVTTKGEISKVKIDLVKGKKVRVLKKTGDVVTKVKPEKKSETKSEKSATKEKKAKK